MAFFTVTVAMGNHTRLWLLGLGKDQRMNTTITWEQG